MTRDLKALRELEKRLAEAKGPDREIDLELREWHVAGLHEASREDVLREVGKARHDPPSYTASLDAAVSLVERVLPGWFPGVEHIAPDFRNEGEDDPPWCANINGPVSWRIQEPELGGYEEPFFDNSMAAANTPALALCLAAVRALIAQGEK